MSDGEITLIGLDDRDAWEAATAERGLPSQTWSYAWGLAADGIVPQLAVVRAGGSEMLLPFFERPFRGHLDIATLPGLSGALLRPDSAAPLAAWADFARRRGWVTGYIQLAAVNAGLTVDPPDSIRAHNAHFVFDMDRWVFATSVSKKARWTLKVGSRVGATLVTDRDRLAAVFPQLYRQTMARAGRAPEFSDDALARWLGDDESIVFGAEIAGRIEMAHLGRARGAYAELHLAGGSDEGRSLNGWLAWHAAEALGERGIRFVDIGGYGQPGDGLHDMKRRLGVDEYPMLSLRQIYDPAAFATLCAETRADPGALYFPPYRAPAARESEPASGQ